MKMKFKKFSMHAWVPQNATPGSACHDVYSAKSVISHPGETKPIETDIGTKFSKKYTCRFYLHSGLSLKPVPLGGGVIDSNFRGIICYFDKSFKGYN